MPEPSLDQPEFTWKAHPAAERRGPAVAAGITIAALGASVGVFMGSVVWGVLAVVVLFLALNRFFLPSRYSIDAEGLTARFPLTKKRFRWSEVRRVATDGRSAYLGTRAKRSWLDAYRGIHVLLGEHGDAVMERLQAHVKPRGDGETAWAR